MDNTGSNKLALHYYLENGINPHSMDAVVRNKCEHEFLQIVNTIAKELNVQIRLETEAHDEGGLVEFYTFICSAEGIALITLANFLVTATGVVLSRIPIKRKNNDILEQELCIEEKRLNILLLQKELEEKSITSTNINLNSIESILNRNLKLDKHKSNLYKFLHFYPKVKGLSSVLIDSNNNPIEDEHLVLRKDFENFILESDNLSPIIDENAIIEIVSPVLKKGKFKWKGYYNKIGNVIDFSMKDKEFKDEIAKENISFKNGTFIDCFLEIERKIDDFGNVFNSNYSVITVMNHHDEESIYVTAKGKKNKAQKEFEKLQQELFTSDGTTNN